MKNAFLIFAASLLFPVITGAQNFLVATSTNKGDDYFLTISNESFGPVFDTWVAPYLNNNPSDEFRFQEMRINDPEPANLSSRAYLEVEAVSSSQTIVIGVKLVKELTDQGTRLFVVNNIPSGEINPERVAEEAGWKCVSANIQCGGCRRIRDNGHVIGCQCLTSGNGYCNFETGGGGGSNWPSWLTSLILALLRMA